MRSHILHVKTVTSFLMPTIFWNVEFARGERSVSEPEVIFNNQSKSVSISDLRSFIMETYHEETLLQPPPLKFTFCLYIHIKIKMRLYSEDDCLSSDDKITVCVDVQNEIGLRKKYNYKSEICKNSTMK